MNEDNKRIIIGKITTTHGHKGEVKVLPLTDFPERFQEMKMVEAQVGDKQVPLHLESVRKHQQFYIIKFAEIPDMNAALTYRDSILSVAAADVKPLPEGRYYHFQLIGLAVFSEAGERLGKVKGIQEPGGHDLLVVEDEAGQEVLIPLVKAWIADIDLHQRRITAKLIPGLL